MLHASELLLLAINKCRDKFKKKLPKTQNSYVTLA